MDSLKIYTERELAAKLFVSQWTVRLWRIQAGLPHFRTTGRIFYRLEAVVQWMIEQEKKNQDVPKEEWNKKKINSIAQ